MIVLWLWKYQIDVDEKTVFILLHIIKAAEKKKVDLQSVFLENLLIEKKKLSEKSILRSLRRIKSLQTVFL